MAWNGTFTWLTDKVFGQLVSHLDFNSNQDNLKQIWANLQAAVGNGTSAPTKTMEELNTAVSSVSKRVGELLLTQELITISESAPFYNLSNADAVLSTTNYPDYVDYLRGLLLRYDPLNTNVTEFDVTAWDITSNVATLTFADTDPENAVLEALLEDKLYHGSYADWRTITLDSAIGDITAGTYAITEVSTSSRYVKFAFTASDNSDTCTETVKFYPHRIVGSTTTARHFQVNGSAFMTPMDADGEHVVGLRRRDRFQGHDVETDWAAGEGGTGAITTGTVSESGSDVSLFNDADLGTDGFISDGTNGTPRTGTTTMPRGMTLFAYQFVGTYSA